MGHSHNNGKKSKSYLVVPVKYTDFYNFKEFFRVLL